MAVGSCAYPGQLESSANLMPLTQATRPAPLHSKRKRSRQGSTEFLGQSLQAVLSEPKSTLKPLCCAPQYWNPDISMTRAGDELQQGGWSLVTLARSWSASTAHVSSRLAWSRQPPEVKPRNWP